jgi:hypothetical protein
MSGEGFLRRWARRKTEVREGREPEPGPAPVAEAVPDAVAASPGATAFAAPQPVPGTVPPEAAAAPARPLPTLDDVAALDGDSDFSAFVARGVDQAVRRSALKKLFADPHFKVMDRLDVYIDDYTVASPVSEAMLASLEHAKSVFAKMIEDEPEAEAEAKAKAKAAPQQGPQTRQPPEQETQ